MNLADVLHCCIIFSTFQDRAWPCRCRGDIWRQYVSFITFEWDGRRPAGVVFAIPPHKKVLVQALTVLRACWFTDVHNCLVIVLWPVSERLLHFAPFLSLFPSCCVMLSKYLSSLACSLSRGSEQRLGLTVGSLFQQKLLLTSLRKQNWALRLKAPKSVQPVGFGVFSLSDRYLSKCVIPAEEISRTPVNY